MKRVEAGGQSSEIEIAFSSTLWLGPSAHLVGTARPTTTGSGTASIGNTDVEKWAVVIGTAKGVMSLLVQGIVYDVITDGNRKPIPNSEKDAKANDGIITATSEQAMKQVLSRISASVGASATGGTLAFGQVFDSLQKEAFVIARKVMKEMSGNKNPIVFAAHLMDLCWQLDSYKFGDDLWKYVTNGTDGLTRGAVPAASWNAALDAINSAIVPTIRETRRRSDLVRLGSNWGNGC